MDGGGAGKKDGEATPVHVDPGEAMDAGGAGQEDGEATPTHVDPAEAMDGGVEEEGGEATPAPPVDVGDLVTLKSAGEHGDRGIVVYIDDDIPEDKLPVLYVGGTVVLADRGDLTVVDRSSMCPGHLVVSASDPGGQVGVVVAVDTELDLVGFDGGAVVARGVSPGELRCVTELSEGDYVASGPWLGRVVELSVEVDVLFDDGAACRVRAPEKKLCPAGVKGDVILRTARNGFYYPGHRVFGADESVFQAARWLNGHWKSSSHVEGTVARVELASVLVSWVAARHLGAKQDVIQASAPPPHQQNPRDLTFVRSDNEGNWAVTDRCFFRDPGRHEPTTTPQPRRKTDRRTRRRAWRHAAFERPMSVADTRTTADVLWQDGTRQRGVPSASLAPFETHVNEFVPGDRVTGARDDGADGDAAAAARFGVVRSLDYKDQTARVSWLRPAASGEEPSEVECDETVSAYDLENDHDHAAFYGDVVVRLPPSESGGGHGSCGDIGGRSTAAAAGEDLSWIGQVVDCCDAYIQVKWSDGNTSKVLPHEIEVVEELSVYVMQDAMGDWVDNADDDTADEEAEEDKQEEPAAADEEAEDDKQEEPAAAAAQHQQDGSADEIAGGEDCAPTAKTTGRLSAFIHALIRLPGEVFARGKRYLVGGTTTTTTAAAVAPSSVPPAAMEMNAEASSTADVHETEAVAAPANCDGEDDDDDGDASDENVKDAAGDVVASADGDESSHFTQFDVLQQCPPDHHFLDDVEQGASGGANKWAKRVQKEWKTLQNNLPDTIYVRAYEDRMDLLRAAMVGAAGTPYQDGLFFFDVQLPASYPAAPPRVFYHSFGLRVNPNLYTSGTVCLSLLDTYDDGEGDERWSPASSTVLQVLVSIQGLVLTEQPYYNESSYEGQLGTPGGARNALPYAENACLLALRTLLHLLRRPPAGFGDLVAGHFRRRGGLVLRACEAYLEGCAVGTLDADARATAAEGGERRPCSSPGLRIALAAVVPRLVEAFAGIGADGCEEFGRPAPPAAA